MRRILKNSVLCKKCNTEVISKYRHDFQTCNCGMCFCDDGGDYRDWETDRKSTRLNSSHSAKSRMPSSA